MDNRVSRRIVIVGGGFAGAYCALELEKRLKHSESDVEILLIDKNNYFIFYPLLLEAGTGRLEPRHAVISIRSFLKRTSFVLGEVTRLDVSQQVVSYTIPGTLEQIDINYNHLVLAPGSTTLLPPIPGLKEHSFQVKSLSDAVSLRDHVIRQLEIANQTHDPKKRQALLRIVVVGGSFTGVETVGEFDVFLKSASKVYPNISKNDCQVVLVELSDRILPALDPDLGSYALRQLKRRGIDIKLKTSVAEITQSAAKLSDGQVLPTQTIVWCAGIAPSSIIKLAQLPKDQRGYLLCERDLSVSGSPDIWGIGDCAVNIDSKGNPYPATAQHAVRQGKHLAKNIVQSLRGQPTAPCNLVNLGSLAALGCRTGVAKVFGVKLSGFAAWFLWRTVYLFKMPGLGRKLRVALDWTMDLMFRPDYVQLGVHRRQEFK